MEMVPKTGRSIPTPAPRPSRSRSKRARAAEELSQDSSVDRSLDGASVMDELREENARLKAQVSAMEKAGEEMRFSQKKLEASNGRLEAALVSLTGQMATLQELVKSLTVGNCKQHLQQKQQKKPPLQRRIEAAQSLDAADWPKLADQPTQPTNLEWTLQLGRRDLQSDKEKRKTAAAQQREEELRQLREAQKPLLPARRQKKMRVRPDAIRVELAEAADYVDLMKILRKDEAVNAATKLAWRSRDDALMLRLNRDAKAEDVTAAVKAAAGSCVKETVLLVPTVGVVIKGIDMCADDAEVAQVVSKVTETMVSPKSVALRRMPDGLQWAHVRVQSKVAKLLTEAKVRIGMTLCWVQYTNPIPKSQRMCYRCLGRGHVAQACKGIDRSKLCLRCGSSAHCRAHCTSLRPKCVICEEEHSTGSALCRKQQQ